MTFVSQILNGLAGVSKPQQKFLEVLFSTLLVVHSAINFLSLGRHSDLSERTFRRQFRKKFDFAAFNLEVAARAQCTAPTTAAIDASFIRKSGKRTAHLAKFWHGTAQRAEKGLELSLIALINESGERAFALSAVQTPANVPKALGKARATRLDFYLAHFQQTIPHLPKSVRYLAADGEYACQKFVTGVCEAGYVVISRLRGNANLKFLYEGEPKGGRGRPKKYDGKVDLQDLSRFEEVAGENAEVKMYSAKVWAVSLKRAVRVLVLVDRRRKEGAKPVVLFSTDVALAPGEILRHYRSRFQIEFLFRDAKQSAGLENCQARDQKALEFHWNASFASLNIAKALAHEEQEKTAQTGFSMKSIKQRIFNEHLLELFISKLGLDRNEIKNHEQYEKLRNYAVIST